MISFDTVAVTPAELKTLQPSVNVDDIGAAAYEPQSGYASPADVVEGFRRQAEAGDLPEATRAASTSARSVRNNSPRAGRSPGSIPTSRGATTSSRRAYHDAVNG